MNEGSLTGIQLSKETRDMLKARKIYGRESYEEVIRRLLEAPRYNKSGAGRPKKALPSFPQPEVELSAEGQETALNEATEDDLDNPYDLKEA